MGLFDNIGAPPSGGGAAQPAGNRTVDVVFARLPDNFTEFTQLPQAALANPFDAAAMTVLALCFYPQDKDACIQMLNFLKGPQPLSTYEQQFLRDRFMDADYVPRSYFNGAVPNNDYKPAQPYTVRVTENPYTYQDQGYAKVYLQSGGADSPRAVQLRLAKDGKWYLWEQFLLAGIRPPESSNPWA